MSHLKLLKIFLVAATMFCFNGIAAQNMHPDKRPGMPPKHDSKSHKEMIHAQKVAYFTNYLELTPEEAEKFWPIYNKYWKELMDAGKISRNALKKLNEALKSNQNIFDAEISKMMENHYALAKRELEITHTMFTEISKVLPIRKAAKLLYAEDKFREFLIRQLKDAKD